MEVSISNIFIGGKVLFVPVGFSETWEGTPVILPVHGVHLRIWGYT